MIKSEKRKNTSRDESSKGKKPKFENKNAIIKKTDAPKTNKPNKDGHRTGKTAPFKGKFQQKPGAGGKFGKGFKDRKDVKGKAPVDEKTDWNKFKKEKKDLKLKRKKAKDLYEVTIEAKQIYEKLKCRSTAKKSELVEKLYDVLNGGSAIPKLIMAHDTARIVQCMLKYASPAFRDQISEKLLPLVVVMATSKYAHFCVLRMLKYGSPGVKSKLVDSFMGNVVRLATHNISSKILDHVYLTVATPLQKSRLRQEFYGDLYKKSKDDSVKKLSDTYSNATNMKASILGAVKANLEHVANKNLVDNSLVHAVILEYIQECDEDKIEETITAFAPLVPMMLTTKDGCQAAIMCFYKSSAKNRRAIVKTIKEHLVKICTHEQGHIFILALLNSLDDTKATKKAIYDTIHKDLQVLMANQWGRRVIEWFVAPGETNFFHPSFIATLDEGLKYGKKDKELRRKEIFEQIEEPIATAIAEQPEFWISEKHIGLVTAEILNRLTGEHFVKAANAVAAVVANPKWSVTLEEESSKEKKPKMAQDVEKIIAEATKQRKKNKNKKANQPIADDAADSPDDSDAQTAVPEADVTPSPTGAGIEEAGLHVVLKKIIKNDKERSSQNPEAETFGSLLAQHINNDTLDYWLGVNRACFILLNIVENNNENTQNVLKNLIKPHKTGLQQQTGSGAQLLLKKLKI